MRRLVLALLFLCACPAPARYVVSRPGLPCDRATRVARKTFVAMGYTVTELVEASVARSGVVGGTKKAPDGTEKKGRVVIRCTAEGATLQPIEDQLVPDYEFSRGFDYSFTTLVQRPDDETPWQNVGLQVLVQRVDVYEAKLDLGDAATVGGAVLVRATVRNNTDRPVRLDVPRLSLVDAGGATQTPLAGAALDAALAANAAGGRVRAELFGNQPIAARTTRVGYLVYPPGTYREARVSVEDVETDESEGFVTPVQ